MGDYGGYLPMEGGLLDLSRDALKYFGLIGCEVSEAMPEFDMSSLWRASCAIRSFLVAGSMRVHYDAPSARALLKEELLWEVERGLALGARELHEASEVRCAWIDEVTRMFQTYDFLVLPATQVPHHHSLTHSPAYHEQLFLFASPLHERAS